MTVEPPKQNDRCTRMFLPDETTLEQICASSRRLPIRSWEHDVAIHAIYLERRKDRDLMFGNGTLGTDHATLSWLAEKGLFIMTSPFILQSTFLIVKRHAGRSLLGRRQALYHLYIGNLEASTFRADRCLSTWQTALEALGDFFPPWTGTTRGT